MTTEEAEHALGSPEARIRGRLRFETWFWFDAALQVCFDGDGLVGEISLTWVPGRVSGRIGNVDLFQRPADEVVERLEPVLGAGISDGPGFEHAWPEARFGLWRITTPGRGQGEFRGGRYWMSASTHTDAFAREAGQRAAVRRDDPVG